MDSLKEKIESLPDTCGVYIFKDKNGEVLYIGKASSIKNRVRSYFQDDVILPKIKVMVERISDVDYILTKSEIEALTLECNLIKKHKPLYNIRLKDDKHYPYIRISVNEVFPRISIVRKVKKDKARYFGPYTSSQAMHKTIRLIKKIFGIRTCKLKLKVGEILRPCLDYHINQCAAPCASLIDIENYKLNVIQTCLFLEGRVKRIIKSLKQKMEDESKNLSFEEAARIRDKIYAVEKTVHLQQAISTDLVDEDVIYVVRENGKSAAIVLIIREGKLIGQERFLIEGIEEEVEGINSFVKHYYSRATHLPKYVIISDSIKDKEIIEEWLSTVRGDRVHIKIPYRGKKLDLLRLAKQNAFDYLAQMDKKERIEKKQALLELQYIAKTDSPPERIEAYDISNIYGKEAVGSMVVFEGGEPKKGDYRRFKIRLTEGINDYGMLQEVLVRRFKRYINKDPKFLQKPDLIVIDGGKGHVWSARKAFSELNLDIPLIGIAKEQERIYTLENDRYTMLPLSSKGLLLLKSIRDEAHRFAITYHRKIRNKEAMNV